MSTTMEKTTNIAQICKLSHSVTVKARNFHFEWDLLLSYISMLECQKVNPLMVNLIRHRDSNF